MISTLRNLIYGLSGTAVVCGALALAFPAVAVSGAPSLSAQEGREVVRVPITGTIEMGLAPFVARALDDAAAAGAAAVVLDIDTPGGRVDAAWQIIDAVRDASVPVYAYVNRRALSAGAMIALSAGELYMRPGSTIGAATPITGDGEKASEKMVSALRSDFRALAEERGFDPRIAEAMVDENVVVDGISEAGKLLTLTTDEAIEFGVANGQVEDFASLLDVVGLPAARTVDVAPNWAEGLVRFLTNPAVAPMLLSLGFLGLLIEIRTPTFGVAGAIGLGALAAFFGAHHLVHLAGLEEILLVAVGLVLILAEVFVIPGFGVAGVLGTGAMLGGTVLGMVGQFPSFDQVFNAVGLVSLSLILVGVSAWALLRHLPKSRRLEGVFLRESTSRDIGYLSAPEREDLIGHEGVAATDLRPAGTAIFGDERIDVVTEGPWIPADTAVRITQAESYRHVVRAIDPEHEIEPPPNTDT